MVVFARTLPALRERVAADLARGGFSFDHVLALAVRLLDRGFFRIGSEDYAVTNETYGLATMRKRHVRVRDGVLYFDYPAKHGKRRVQAVIDPDVGDDLCRLKRRRGGGDELLAYKEGRRWVDVKSADINAWLKDATGEDVSAKDFRTWGATVLAAVGLAVSPVPDTKTARRRAMARVVKEVAHHLGNTPAVARASYIDPRTFDRYLDGVTIAGAIPELAEGDDGTAIQGRVEAAVLELLTGEESPAMEPPGGEEIAAELAAA
jgi:DNA topoisomerase IB